MTGNTLNRRETSQHGSLAVHHPHKRGARTPRHLFAGGSQRCISVLICSWLWFFAFTVYGNNSIILPEWKAHFTNTPVIEDCVVERTLYNGAKTSQQKIYQFKLQSNAFLVREIQDLRDAQSDYTTALNVYAGRYGSNYWDINRSGLLELYPNADKMMAEGKDPNGVGVWGAAACIEPALYYGINFLNPRTVKWINDTDFTAYSVSGKHLSGSVSEVMNGLPKTLEWQFDDGDRQFFLEYAYEGGLGLPYYPTDIRLYSKLGRNEKKLVCAQKIVIMAVSSTSLPEEVFLPGTYFRPRPYSASQTIVFTNSERYLLGADGKLSKMLLISDVPPEQFVMKKTNRNKWLFFTFIIVPMLIFILSFFKKQSSSTA